MASYPYFSKNIFSSGVVFGMILCSLYPELTSASVTNTSEIALSDLLISDICATGGDIDTKELQSNISQSAITAEKKQIKILCARLKSELAATRKAKEEEKEDIVKYYLPQKYDKHAAPKSFRESVAQNGTKIITSKPTTCSIYLHIRSVREVDEAKEQITLDMDFLIVWVDGGIWENLIKKNVSNRNRYPYEEAVFIPLPAELLDKVWVPDLFFEEVVSVARPRVLYKSAQSVLFNPHVGSFYMRARTLITLHCNMDFAYYPSDTQKCQIFIRSDAHRSNELTVKWWKDRGYGVYLLETSDPNFDYQITDIKEIKKSANLGPETHYERTNDYLWFEIAIRRKMSFHLIQTYLPSVFFMTVTWLCFLIPTRMFEARVGVAMTTLLTQTSMFSSIRESTPNVGYVKAIDTWMVACILFIFLALFAFTIGAWVRQHRERLNQAKSNRKAGQTNRIEDVENGVDGKKKRSKLVHINFDKRIERFTVILLSFGFLTFAATYWTWLLVGSDHLNWKVNSTWNEV